MNPSLTSPERPNRNRDAPARALVTHQAMSKFNLAEILHHVVSNNDLASFLFSKEQLPPTSLSADLLNQCFGIQSTILNDEQTGVGVLAHIEPNPSDENDSDGSINRGAALPPQNEAKTFVFHNSCENVTYLSSVDGRTPIAFIEKPYPVVPGVHRSVGIKLDYHGQEVFVVLANIWLTSGRSTLVIICYTWRPQFYSEKHFLLLEKYPVHHRFPKMSDVLEQMTAVEQYVCQFCYFRKSLTCECSSKMTQRALGTILPPQQMDPRSLFLWAWTVYEANTFRKYSVVLQNYNHSAVLPMSVYHLAHRLPETSQGHSEAVRHYLSALQSVVTNPLVPTLTWKLPQQRLVFKHAKQEHQQHDPPMIDAVGFDILVSIPNNKPHEEAMQDNLLISSLFCPTGKYPVELKAADIQIESGEDVEIDADGSSLSEQQEFLDYLKEVNQMPWSSKSRCACRYCPDRFFTRKHDLKRHIMSRHQKQREFRCEFCTDTFIRKSHLEVHRRRYHSQCYHFVCPICSKEYSYYSARSKHLKAAHGITKPMQQTMYPSRNSSGSVHHEPAD